MGTIPFFPSCTDLLLSWTEKNPAWPTELTDPAAALKTFILAFHRWHYVGPFIVPLQA